MSRITKSFTFEGKRYFIRGDSEAEVTEKLIRKKIELEEGRKRISKNTTVSAWCEEWLTTYKEPAVSETWFIQLQRYCRNVIGPEIGHLQLKDVKPIHIQKLMNSKQDLSGSYLKKLHEILKDIFQKAVENDLLLQSPAEAVIRPVGKKKQSRRSITPYERKMVLRLCQKHRAGRFIMIMLYSGLRPGEVAALEWRHIDFKSGFIKVEQALKKSGQIGDPKSEAGKRKVPLQSPLRDILIEYRQDPFSPVCTNASGGRLTETSIRQMWNSFVYNLNIEMGCRTHKGGLVPPLRVADDLVMYCFRHTYCTDLQAAGVPINVARELMGHTDISLTAQIYTHSSTESLSAAYEAMEALERARAGNETESVDENVT